MRPKMGILTLMAFVVACGTLAADEYRAITSGVRYTHIGRYDTTRLDQILSSELKDFETTPMGITFPPVTNAVNLYRVIYPTVVPEKGNRAVEASGLVAVPDVALEGRTFPLVSWQHGTVFSKTEVPSFPEESMETRMLIAHLGGNGYVVVGADYIGLGLSTEPNSYMVRDANIQASVDMLAAARHVLTDLGVTTDALFLSGWSQGAYNTQVLHRRLEQQGVPIMASATAATPSCPYMLATRWINKRTEFDVQWILGTVSMLIGSYEEYYDLPGLSAAAIKPAYLQQARDFYANKITWDALAASWPQSTAELLNEDFAAASSPMANRFFQLLFENQAYAWRSKTPARYYYGAADECIAPYISTLPVGYQDALGGASATAHFAGEKADHRGSFVFGVHDQKEWFDGFRR